MTYQITKDNYLYKGEMVKMVINPRTKDVDEVFIMYDTNGKKHYSTIMSIIAEFDNLESALHFQKLKEKGNAETQKN